MLRNMFRKTYTKIDTKYRPVSHEGEEPSKARIIYVKISIIKLVPKKAAI